MPETQSDPVPLPPGQPEVGVGIPPVDPPLELAPESLDRIPRGIFTREEIERLVCHDQCVQRLLREMRDIPPTTGTVPEVAYRLHLAEIRLQTLYRRVEAQEEIAQVAMAELIRRQELKMLARSVRSRIQERLKEMEVERVDRIRQKLGLRYLQVRPLAVPVPGTSSLPSNTPEAATSSLEPASNSPAPP